MGEAAPLLQVRGLRRSYYGVRALDGVDLDVAACRLTGLIGPNGAGKTTLFNCVSGLAPPQAGRVVFAGEEIGGSRPDRIAARGLVRTFQIARGCPRLTVRENLLLYGKRQPGEHLAAALLRTRRMRRREAELQDRAEAIAQRLSLGHVLDNKAAALSGGQKKLLEIGRALMAEPRMILLDEPTAGVNPSLARDIGERLREMVADGITLLLIEHQMDMIARLCDHVIVMAEGRRSDRGQLCRGLGRPGGAGGVYGAAPLSLLTVAGLVAGYSAADHILKGLDFRLGEREMVCIIGPNGAGKSTLLKAIAGLLRPSAGSITLAGRSIVGLRPREVTGLGVAYVPQEHNVFPSMTVRENLEMGGYADPDAARKRLDRVMQRFPVLGREAPAGGARPVRRRAADPGDGHGADGRAAPAAAGRALGRAVAGRGARPVRATSRRSTATAWRSRWSSRTPTRRSRSRAGRISWWTAATAAKARPARSPATRRFAVSSSAADAA